MKDTSTISIKELTGRKNGKTHLIADIIFWDIKYNLDTSKLLKEKN